MKTMHRQSKTQGFCGARNALKNEQVIDSYIKNNKKNLLSIQTKHIHPGLTRPCATHLSSGVVDFQPRPDIRFPTTARGCCNAGNNGLKSTRRYLDAERQVRGNSKDGYYHSGTQAVRMMPISRLPTAKRPACAICTGRAFGVTQRAATGGAFGLTAGRQRRPFCS